MGEQSAVRQLTKTSIQVASAEKNKTAHGIFEEIFFIIISVAPFIVD